MINIVFNLNFRMHLTLFGLVCSFACSEKGFTAWHTYTIITQMDNFEREVSVQNGDGIRGIVNNGRSTFYTEL